MAFLAHYPYFVAADQRKDERFVVSMSNHEPLVFPALNRSTLRSFDKLRMQNERKEVPFLKVYSGYTS